MKPNWVTTYSVLHIVQWCAIVISAVFAGAQKANVDDWKQRWEFASEALAWVQVHNWLLIPIMAGIATVTAAARRLIGPPWIWAAIEKVLEELRKVAFRNPDATPANHRVTLFKRVRILLPFWWVMRWRGIWPYGRWRWPWSGWLVAKCRTGHVRQRSKEVFLAPDDAHNAEGIAGHAYTQKVYRVANLPALNSHSSDDEIRQYAQVTHVPPSWVKQRLRRGDPLSRAYMGLVVEVNNKPWGIIMLDSLDPDALLEQRTIGNRFVVVARVLSELLRKA